MAPPLEEGTGSSLEATIKPLIPDWAKQVLRHTRFAPRRATSSFRLLPDFIILGAQRSGTTSLYQYLSQHPCVGRAYQKEIHFFNQHYGRGVGWYRAHFPTVAYKTVVEARQRHRMLTGEATPYYLFDPRAPRRIRTLLPAAKLIVLLRDPVERAYSHYQHSCLLGQESLSFEEAIAREPERLRGERERMLADESYYSLNHQRYSYRARGIYVDQLQEWMSLFPRQQFLVLDSTELFEQPAAALQKTLAFLGLPPWQPNAFPVFNRTDAAAMNGATRERLEEFFAPHNRRLRDFLGAEFPWTRS
ncbi:MAG: sulfotransferase domain-containing protein [Acidobacteria bacterium]|nr:sulfotransferase domain-containing protein [Acidobacteriota bacterium]